ncbi:pyrimidine 5'-nucleotidase [Vibrio sp. Isolate25]|uniref:pyrimidine 5'-nucleotidase n=1 Tax=unclassified Vibrio TaxID=2614977 RepID=UPI001EFDC9ED|nr:MULTISPECIES: pyrimidine 5'-nucleotidase [unclassified Vibrio]MCG9595866.1 pyrimidine 5'-nucleotidase [Vibrio sp. Isolate25]MCG9677363.1 pyrimidine 5'-nucleotidase [Vibrio sp. Isolate24]
MKYDWILFDADETLFHFDAFQGMQLMFSRKGVEFTQDDYNHYQKVNKPLWVDYQNGAISAHELKHTRFEEWAAKLETTTSELNSAFLDAMADICTLLPGAKELMDALQGKAKLGIITNGFTELQAIRLERTGMTNYFEHVIISEEVGIAKPDVGIFTHALEKMGSPCKSKILMVGDNPHSDILGGINFGIETCWLNCAKQDDVEGIVPNHTVSSLFELKEILLA